MCSSLSQDAVCSKCEKTIETGDMAVFAERAGDDKCWHVGCFTCEEDGDFLVDLFYCYKDGSLYCCRHWAEKLKPRCAGCEEVLT